MKERLWILLGVLAGAYLVWGLFAPRLPAISIERPLSTQSGANGFLGLQRWLAQSGVPTHSLREPLTSLTGAASRFARPGNILITVMPHHARPDRDEMNALLDWVSEGNTLVILAGLNDTPLWTSSADTSTFVDDVTYLVSITPTFRPTEDRHKSTADGESPAGDETAAASDVGALSRAKAQEFLLDGIPGHWLTAKVKNLAARSDLPTGPWDLDADPEAPAYVIAREPGENVDAILITDLGKGAIILSTFASLWQNSMIGQRDNRQLVVNLLAHHLRPGSSVIFDDFHHGLTNIYDASAFFADPRLARTAALLLCFWLVYAVFSDSRLGPPVEPDSAPSQTAFVRTLGGFLCRKVSGTETGLRLVENFLAHVQPYLDPGPADTIWQRVGAASRMNGDLAESLRRDHVNLQSGRSVDLQQLQRRLRAARRAFS